LVDLVEGVSVGTTRDEYHFRPINLTNRSGCFDAFPTAIQDKAAGLSRRIGACDSGLIKAAQAEQLSQGPLQQNPRIEAKEAGHRTWLPLLVM
jgi:hypothetical protein